MNRFTRSATNVIAAVTALAWLIAVALGQLDQATLVMGFIPARLSGHAVAWAAVPAFLTPLSATLVHSPNPMHIGFNLLILVFCGREIERVLGTAGLIILYLVGAYASAFGQWALDPLSATPMVGASGAISAIMGAFALSFGRAKRITNNFRLNRWVNVIWLMIAWVALQIMMDWLAGGYGYQVAWGAHVGGFIAGLLLQRPLLLWRYRNA